MSRLKWVIIISGAVFTVILECVERSFLWLEDVRRLTIGYEFLADTAEAIVLVAFILILLNKFIE